MGLRKLLLTLLLVHDNTLSFEFGSAALFRAFLHEICRWKWISSRAISMIRSTSVLRLALGLVSFLSMAALLDSLLL